MSSPASATAERPGGGIAVTRFLEGAPAPDALVRAAERARDTLAAVVSDDPLHVAFPPRVTAHAGARGLPVPEEERPELLERLWREPAEGLGLAYVHVPFCTSRCSFCGFYLAPYSPEAGDDYVVRVEREIEGATERLERRGMLLAAIYLGGGTPTALGADALARLLRALKRLPTTNDCEVTVETRVSDLDRPRIEACLAEGANRFSVGLQTFDTEVRRRLGRRVAGDEAASRLALAASYRKAAVVVDLLFGLPGQTESSWLDDLDAVGTLGIDGVDLYELLVFPGTPLARQVAEPHPAAEMARPDAPTLFRMGVERQARRGARRLSVRHWAFTERERRVYNRRVASGADIVPFGCAAGGNLVGHRLMHARDLAGYAESVDAGLSPVRFLSRPAPRAALHASLTGAIDGMHLDLERLGNHHGVDLEALLGPLLSQWEDAGLVVRDGPSVELTVAGQFWSVALAQRLVDAVGLLDAAGAAGETASSSHAAPHRGAS